jgi:hypothetical protein
MEPTEYDTDAQQRRLEAEAVREKAVRLARVSLIINALAVLIIGICWAVLICGWLGR